MALTFAALTDMHFGPRALFQGKLRKLSDLAPELTRRFVERMNRHVHPDLVIALGDFIQDETPELDRTRYSKCIELLCELEAPVHFVAGNHDTIHQSDHELVRAWGTSGELYYSFDHGEYHFVVLRTVERRELDVCLPQEQLSWLKDDLRRTERKTIVAMHHSAADQDVTGNLWFERAPQLALVRNRNEVREVLSQSGKVMLVMNGHLHWNHVDLHDGIPYVTVQSLTENIDEDAPGRPAEALAVVRVDDRSLRVTVDGAAPTRYEQHFV
jgi:3',5'-cyclic AMP phosphodiesterase CpdA